MSAQFESDPSDRLVHHIDLNSTPTLVIIGINIESAGKFTRPGTAREFRAAKLQSTCRT